MSCAFILGNFYTLKYQIKFEEFFDELKELENTVKYFEDDSKCGVTI